MSPWLAPPVFRRIAVGLVAVRGAQGAFYYHAWLRCIWRRVLAEDCGCPSIRRSTSFPPTEPICGLFAVAWTSRLRFFLIGRFMPSSTWSSIRSPPVLVGAAGQAAAWAATPEPPASARGARQERLATSRGAGWTSGRAPVAGSCGCDK